MKTGLKTGSFAENIEPRATLDDILEDAMVLIRSRGADAILVLHLDGECVIAQAGECDAEMRDGARVALENVFAKADEIRANPPVEEGRAQA